MDVDHRNIPVQASECINLLYLFLSFQTTNDLQPIQLLWPANGITQHAEGWASEQAMRQQRRIDQIWLFLLCAAVDCVAPETKTQHRQQKQETKSKNKPAARNRPPAVLDADAGA